jgi:two-component system chemotaxis response regulator CheY
MTSHPPAGPGKIRRILSVDDEPALRHVVALHLQRVGYEVETASDGHAAWQHIVQDLTRFDAVVTDNQMPQLSGIALVEKLRASGFTGKIVFFSSTLAPQNAARLSRLGVDGIVEKGTSITALTDTLRRAFGPE